MRRYRMPMVVGAALAAMFIAPAGAYLALAAPAAGGTVPSAGDAGAPTSDEGRRDHEELEAMAREFVTVWSNGDYQGAVATFDETMRRMMPPEKMKEAWESLITRVGDFEGRIGTRTEKWNEYVLVFVTCRFAASPIDIKVVYDRERRIAGLWFVPTEQAEAEYEPPPYANREAFREEDVRVGTGEWELPGTLSLPAGEGSTPSDEESAPGGGESSPAGEGPFPAVVLVHGSGPNDRDETVGPNRPFRDLAWGLATRGIAVLRYDKRTKAHGKKMAALEGGFTIREETVDDAVAAVRLLRNDPRIDGGRIFLLGHSLGGYCVPMMGRQDPEITGFIIMAGAARPLEDLLIEQYTYIFSLDGEISEEERIELDKIEKQVAAVKDPNLSPDTPRESLPLGIGAAYWLDLRGYDPAAMAAGLEQPLLVLRGGRDYQSTAVDLEKLKAALAAHPDATFKQYPSLNHLFIAGEGPCTPEEYMLAGHVAETVVDDIAKWIALH